MSTRISVLMMPYHQGISSISISVTGSGRIWTGDQVSRCPAGPRSWVSSLYYRIIITIVAARRSDNNMVKQLLFATRIPGHVQPVGRPCGTWMHYARYARDVKDMGQQMGYRSLEWNWPKETMNRPLVLLMEPSCFNLLVNS